MNILEKKLLFDRLAKLERMILINKKQTRTVNDPRLYLGGIVDGKVHSRISRVSWER